jgi:hypothetical protein
MMNLEEPVLLQLLLVSNALLAGAAAFAVLRCNRLLRRSAGDITFSEHTTAATVQDDTQTQDAEERLLALQELAAELAAKEKMLQRGAAESQYENAVRMVQGGADADDLTRTCGLNKGAAQLMVRLHANTPSPASAH